MREFGEGGYCSNGSANIQVLTADLQSQKRFGCGDSESTPIPIETGNHYKKNSLVVDDPSFPSKHLSYALNNPGHLYTLNDYPNFYFAENQLDNTSVAIRLPRQVENNDLGEDTLDLPKDLRIYALEHASFHGLVCQVSILRQSIYVFNPIIREHVRLPDPLNRGVIRWGFGFAPITQKYKFYCYSAGNVDGKIWCFSSVVYTLGVDESWRKISCAPYPEIISRKHVCSKRAFYWTLHSGKANNSFPNVKFEPGTFNVLPLDPETQNSPKRFLERPIDHILSLDLETELFRKRQIDLDQETKLINLALVGETVAAVADLYNGLKIYFLMDEDKDIWEVKYNVPCRITRYSFGIKHFYHLDFMGLWMNQELYFCEKALSSIYPEIYDFGYFSFTPGDNKFSHLRFLFPKDVQREITPQLILPHVGSLLSPVKIMTAGKRAAVN